MIYSNIEEFKSEIQWLAYMCSLPHFSSSRLPAYKYLELENNITRHDDAFVTTFIKTFFHVFNLVEPLWEETLLHETLPALALIPNKGIRVVLELESGDSWRCDGPNGIENFQKFPKNTKFTSIEIKRTEKTKTTASEMFKSIAWRQKPIIIHAAIASLSINMLALGTSFYSMQIYDRVIPTQGISTLIALTVGVFIAILLEMLVKISRSSILDHASRNMDISFSHTIFHRFLSIRSDSLPKSIGTLSGQLQSYSAVRGFISSAALYVVVDFPFAIIFLVAIVLIAGWQMGAIALVFLFISIIVGTFSRKKIDELSKTSSMASHKKLGLLVETVESAEYVKANGAGWSILSRWNALTKEGANDDIAIRHYSEISNYLSAFFQQISYVVLVGAGAYLVATTSSLTMGGLIATTILSGRVLSPIGMLPGLFVQWGRAKIAILDLNRVFALESDNEGIARPLSPEILLPKYNCQNIQFAYGKDMSSIEVASLKIGQGERIAILGIIGSGKSTLLKILAGLYMPQTGNVLFGDYDMQHLSRSRISELIGYLPQSIKLFSGTLRDNLLSGLVGINDDQILEASKKTGLINLISTFPQGLDTLVPEGGESVSGGQKQIIALTRMILLSPKIWLLDEPTANMDDGTERNILGLLHQHLTKEQTLIIVTHKPALLGIVNRVMVMTPQGIVIDGPRDAVLQQLSNTSKPSTQGNV